MYQYVGWVGSINYKKASLLDDTWGFNLLYNNYDSTNRTE